ncbi:MAG: hypothetical protein V1914_00115 [archaeon]
MTEDNKTPELLTSGVQTPEQEEKQTLDEELLERINKQSARLNKVVEDEEAKKAVIEKPDFTPSTVDYSPEYELVTKRICDENPEVVEGIMDEIIVLYADNIKTNGKKAEGFGTKVYSRLNDHLKKEHFGFQDATKNAGNKALKRLIESYHGLDEKKLNKELEDEEKLNSSLFDGIRSQVAKTLTQRLNSEAIEDIKEHASGDAAGFRSYVKVLADKQDVDYKENDMESFEGIFGVYLESANKMIQEKHKKKR